MCAVFIPLAVLPIHNEDKPKIIASEASVYFNTLISSIFIHPPFAPLSKQIYRSWCVCHVITSQWNHNSDDTVSWLDTMGAITATYIWFNVGAGGTTRLIVPGNFRSTTIRDD